MSQLARENPDADWAQSLEGQREHFAERQGYAELRAELEADGEYGRPPKECATCGAELVGEYEVALCADCVGES